MLAAAMFAVVSPAGMWHAYVLDSANKRVEFRMELSESAGVWTGHLINGAGKTTSTSGSWDGHRLRLEFNYWDVTLEAETEGAALRGTVRRPLRKTKLVRKFFARRMPFPMPSAPPGGDAAGEWMLELDGKKPQVWRAQFTQSGNAVSGVLTPVTGDSGEMSGTIANGRMKLYRFDGVRTILLDLKLRGDGSAGGTLNYVITRYNVRARRAGMATYRPPDALGYTRMKNAAEPFRFEYPDLDGRTISDRDFAGKGLIVSITGSWCPNCHDEAAVLSHLYSRYHAQGLEVILLGFEYTGDVERDRRQLRVFKDKLGLAFPILLAGTTDEAEQKLSQLENFGAYPTTIFIGRDGRVRSIHAGFDGPSTGERYTRIAHEMEESVKELLR